MLELLAERMRQQQPQLVQTRPLTTNRTSSGQPPTLPPITAGREPNLKDGAVTPDSPQLPSLSSSGVNNQDRILTPIAEGGSTMTHGRGMSVDVAMNVDATSPTMPTPSGQTEPNQSDSSPPLLDREYSSSPVPAPSPPLMNITSGTGKFPISNVVEAQPLVQPARLSSSVDRNSSPNQSRSPLPLSTLPPISSNSSRPSPSTKLDKPGISRTGFVPDSRSEVEASNHNSNSARLTVVSLEPLISPYSPIDEPATPTAMARTESNSTGPKSSTTPILTSPYPQKDHYITGDTVSVLTSPYSMYDGRTRASGEFQSLGKMDLPASYARRPSKSGQSLSPSSTGVKTGGTHEPDDNLLNDVRALYLMHQSRLESDDDAGTVAMPGGSNEPRVVPMPPISSDDDDNDDDEDEEGEEDQESEPSKEIPQPPSKGVFFFPWCFWTKQLRTWNDQPHHLPLPTRPDHCLFDRELRWHSWIELKQESPWLLHRL